MRTATRDTYAQKIQTLRHRLCQPASDQFHERTITLHAQSRQSSSTLLTLTYSFHAVSFPECRQTCNGSAFMLSQPQANKHHELGKLQPTRRPFFIRGWQPQPRRRHCGVPGQFPRAHPRQLQSHPPNSNRTAPIRNAAQVWCDRSKR